MPQGKRMVRYLAVAIMALHWQVAMAQSSATPQSLTEPRIAFVKIDVNDLDAAASSYCKALQMQDIGRIHNKAPLLDEATLKLAVRLTVRGPATPPALSWSSCQGVRRCAARRIKRRPPC